MLMFRVATLIDNGFDMPPGMQIQTAMKIHHRGVLTSSYNHFNCHNLTEPYRNKKQELKKFSVSLRLLLVSSNSCHSGHPDITASGSFSFGLPESY
jgi:hypothetical protein